MKGPLLKGLLYFLGHLPLRINHALGGFIGWLLWLFPTREKNTSCINLAKCFPEKSREWHNQVARKSLIETGKTLTESPVLWYASKERIRSLVTGVSDMRAVDQAIALGRGAILVSPHIGSWEMTGLYSATLYPMTSLYQKPKIRELDQLLKQARQTTGSTLVPTTPGGLKQLQQALANNECIGILPDQEPKGSGGVFAPFFGVPAYTMTLLMRLASSQNIPIIFSFAERLPKGKGYYFHIVEPDEKIYDPDPEIAATALNAAVEEIIRIRPEQYMWNYKRFKRRPPDEAPFY
jgi:Kdo2-lipid IVA lauroyltransferase/acyltransferase